MNQLRQLRRAWRWPGAALVVGAIIVALAGGFETYQPPRSDTEVGQWITLTRWKVRIDGCEARAGDPEQYTSNQIAIRMRVVNTWTETQTGINSQTVAIELPTGEQIGPGFVTFTLTDTERSGGFDPGLEREAVLVGTPEQTPDWSDEQLVRVRLASERISNGFAVANNWEGVAQVASVELPCPVRSES